MTMTRIAAIGIPLVIVILLLAWLQSGNSANPGAAGDRPSAAGVSQTGQSVRFDPASYRRYLESYKDEARPDVNLLLTGASYAAEELSGVTKPDSFAGEADVIAWADESGWVEWTFTVPETGLYNLGIRYYPLPAKGRDIELSVEIDGEVPFDGAGRLEFARIWQDGSAIARDNRGNDIRPKQAEAPAWIDGSFIDTDGLQNDPYLFHLTAGEHVIRLYKIREALAIAGIRVYQHRAGPAYAEVAAAYDQQGYAPSSGELLILQAEQAYRKSHSTLYPTYDRSSAATQPADPAKVRLNTIGQYNWGYQGQWISWQFDVPEDGLYQIGFKARQNFVRGMYSTRKVYIDGELPFREMDNVKFPYKFGWYTKVLGDDEPYLFRLTAGRHEIRLETAPGDIGETLQAVQSAVLGMNDIYRRIIMITGASPDPGRASGNSIDPYRDYRLEEKIPGLLDSFAAIRGELQDQLVRLDRITAGNGSEASLLEEIIHQLDDFIREPDTIATRLDRYKSNVSSLGLWILEMREQPLELDYLFVKSPDRKAPKAKANFFAQMWFDTRAFLASFGGDYNAIGNSYDGSKAIAVWVSANDLATSGIATGRDQAQIIKSMIDDLFTPETGIEVNLSLVDSSQTLVQAALAGKGPDVAMFVPKEMPVNLAMRGALTDLSTFPEYGEISKRFFASAAIPFEFEGGHYAMPETQDFYMMFYRKDIFAELGLTVPNTWDEFYDMVPAIQKRNMDIGIPKESQTMFETLLFQRGGTFYTADRKSTDFDKPAALEAFKEWTGFYTRYSFPLEFDFYNRFRTGEMPIGIMPYTTYNLLAVAAPELRNLWEMAPIPGTPREDGTINRMGSSTGSGTIMLSDAGDPDSAFRFIDWWTSADVQARFGIEQESLMGPAARYNTANIEAFNKLPWSNEEAERLMTQWQQVWDIPQLPGNYYTSRNINFAFRKVVFDNKNERETLNRYNQEINKEILRKRAEFNLQ